VQVQCLRNDLENISIMARALCNVHGVRKDFSTNEMSGASTLPHTLDILKMEEDIGGQTTNSTGSCDM
jgi:hypothetical protein